MNEEEMVEWVPKTKLGKKVNAGEITSIDEIFDNGLVIRESEIVDKLIPDLEEGMISVGKAKRPFKMVQRMTDSGRRNNFLVLVAVGNGNGYVGLGGGRAKEYGPALKKALRNAKLNLIKIPTGCGSWECSCGGNHSLPYKVSGKAGSVRIDLKPAPNGIGIVANDSTKTIMRLAGVKDVWSKSYGHTKTRTNLAMATFDALNNLKKVKAR